MTKLHARTKACLWALAANTTPALGAIIPIDPIIPIVPILPTPPPATASARACTTYITTTDYGFRGNFTPLIEKTVYTATVTQFKRVPCGGCELAFTAVDGSPYGGIGPVERITGTITATQPTTITATVCGPTGHRGPPPPGPAEPGLEKPYQEAAVQNVARDKSPGGGKNRKYQTLVTSTLNATNSSATTPSQSSECTYTQMVPLTPLRQGTVTIWPTTSTITSRIDCDGCKYVAVSTRNFLNHGPVVHFTTTITASVPSYTTVFMCRKTPSVVVSPTGTPSLTVVPDVPRMDAMITPTPTPVTLTHTVLQYQSTVTRWSSIVCEPRPTLPIDAMLRGADAFKSPNVQIAPGMNTVVQLTTVVVPGARTLLSFTCTATSTRKYPHPTGTETAVGPIFPPVEGPELGA